MTAKILTSWLGKSSSQQNIAQSSPKTSCKVSLHSWETLKVVVLTLHISLTTPSGAFIIAQRSTLASFWAIPKCNIIFGDQSGSDNHNLVLF